VALPAGRDDDVAQLAERLRAGVEAAAVGLTVSAGYAVATEAADCHSLVESAERCHYWAKALGRNRISGPSMMSRVVILNGPAGVGKTTVGRLLAGRPANGVCIEGDALARFIVARVPGAVREGLGYENGATIAANYLRGGYELVVFEYCFEERAHVERFLDAYTGPAPVFLFTLWAPLALVERRESARAGRRRLGERVPDCYRAMEEHLAELGDLVDATGDPYDIAALIDERTLAGTGLCRAASSSP
jgi:hypothetical protein